MVVVCKNLRRNLVLNLLLDLHTLKGERATSCIAIKLRHVAICGSFSTVWGVIALSLVSTCNGIGVRVRSSPCVTDCVTKSQAKGHLLILLILLMHTSANSLFSGFHQHYKLLQTLTFKTLKCWTIIILNKNLARNGFHWSFHCNTNLIYFRFMVGIVANNGPMTSKAALKVLNNILC